MDINSISAFKTVFSKKQILSDSYKLGSWENPTLK